MINIKLSDLILRSSRNYLKLQREDGSFKQGHNGPWDNKETPVRNTAHIALLLFKAYKISGKNEYLLSAKRACDFIMLDKNRPNNFNFLCRTEGDRVNGLIGVSWALEPLIFIGKELKINSYLEFSKKIIKMHNYDNKRNLWEIKNLNGTDGPVCMTLNQQIWFGMMVLTLGNATKDKSLIFVATRFFSNLSENIDYLGNGVLSHVVPKRGFKKWLIDVYELAKGNKDYIAERSMGYFPFLASGFALAYLNNKDSEIWKDEKMIRVIRFILTSLKKNYSSDKFPNKNPFIGQYNPIGFEIAFTFQTFSHLGDFDQTEIKKWVEFQVRNYFNFDNGFMDKNTGDKEVLSARLYESIYLKNYDLSIG